MRISTTYGIRRNKASIDVSVGELGSYIISFNSPEEQLPSEHLLLVISEEEARKLWFQLNTALLHKEMTDGSTDA